MNIVINTQLMLKGKLDGIGWFTWETVRRITADHPEHTFYLIFDRSSHGFTFGKNVIPVVLRPPSRHPLLWFLRFEMLLPFVLKKYKADLFISPDGWMTLGSKVPSLQVLHDINFMHYPKDFAFFTRKYYTLLFPMYARRATRIVTVSNYSRHDIIKTLGIDSNKIDVVYNGCNDVYKPMDETHNQKVRERFAGGRQYFLYVGMLIPRKNIARLFKAFDQFKEKTGSDMRLLMVGQKKRWTDQIQQAYQGMKHKDDVVFVGRMGEEELHHLYAAALALTFVPYFEGFGIPILEAFNSGTAVITSNITSMPEVAGDAALLCDPFSVDSIAQAMIDISSNEELRTKLINNALMRGKQFSWDNTARTFWKSVEKVIDKK